MTHPPSIASGGGGATDVQINYLIDTVKEILTMQKEQKERQSNVELDLKEMQKEIKEIKQF